MLVKLICFDLGRVLVGICDSMSHAAQVAGLSVPVRELDPHGRAKFMDVVIGTEVGEFGIDEFCDRASKVYEVDPTHVRAMSDVYITGAYEGVGELLDELHQAGYSTACLSNTNENHWRIMFDPNDPNFAPLQRLKQRYASHLIGARKPDPRIYEFVERELNIKPGEIVFFDDLPENIEAASKRGWIARLIQHDGQPVRQMREHLRELAVLG